LAGGVAHDFNNMLGVIIGHGELALERVAVHEPVRDDLEQILQAGRRSADLTRQLLAFARKQTVSPRVLDLNATVEGVLRMLRRLIGADIALEWRPEADVWPVRIDPSQVDQVLANLAVNSRDAIGGAGGRICIRTANVGLSPEVARRHPGSSPGDYVLLSVEDNGCGMDEATLSHVFEPFFTTKEQGRGTGLGLATVYGVVRQNGGVVEMRSTPGVGTTVDIYLPRHSSHQELTEEPPAAAERDPGTGTVLLVEDEAGILNMARMMLERLGYRVLAASTAGEAIALARGEAGDIHLLMTDVVMPEMNGRDLARAVMQLRPGIARLFMSGYTADVIAHEGVLEEGVHFLQKPFTRAELARRVREAMAAGGG
jgi:CheY-like chemotaxis protein